MLSNRIAILADGRVRPDARGAVGGVGVGVNPYWYQLNNGRYCVMFDVSLSEAIAIVSVVPDEKYSPFNFQEFPELPNINLFILKGLTDRPVQSRLFPNQSRVLVAEGLITSVL